MPMDVHRRVVPGIQNSQGKGVGGGRSLGSVGLASAAALCQAALPVKQVLIMYNVYVMLNPTVAVAGSSDWPISCSKEFDGDRGSFVRLPSRDFESLLVKLRSY